MLRVPTSDGILYFKAPRAAYAFESAVTQILIRRCPDLLPELVAAEDAEGWMLLRDAGTQLTALLEQSPGLGHWEDALPVYAELQIGAAEDAEELAAAIPVDRRLEALPAHYDQLLADREQLRIDSGGLTAAELAAARRLTAEVVSGCAELAAFAVPESIQNDDLGHGSIFRSPGRWRFLDWGDACVSHPFFSLTVTLRVIELTHSLPPGSQEIERIRDAYLEPWTVYESSGTLVRLATQARSLGQACRAVHWHHTAAALDASEVDPEDASWSLRLFLEPEAWRSAT